MKYYEILPTHTETPRNATRKIANLYIEFDYHFLTLQKKIPLLLNRSVQLTYCPVIRNRMTRNRMTRNRMTRNQRSLHQQSHHYRCLK